MNIIADENLAFTEYFFSAFGNIKTLPGRKLSPDQLGDAEALLVRSVTKVNAELLQESQISFVGSATIGTDHLDTVYLEKQNISWANAAGCNAQAVAEYVVTALLTLKPALVNAQQAFCLGIVGLGNVGQRLAQLAKKFNWKVIGTDPFTQHTDIEQTDLETLLRLADAVSIHVPLTHQGIAPTHHLFNQHTLSQLKPSAILINSARGSVIEEKALIQDIQTQQRLVVLDVYEHEPVISEQLMDLLALATPHIAGYSLEGKARGTQMIYESFCKKFAFTANKSFESQLETCPQILKASSLQQDLMMHLESIYDIRRDDAELRACIKNGFVDQQAFDALRKNYPLRREWAAYGALV